MKRVVIPALLVLSGCGAGVDGPVDGAAVPTLLSAFFIQDQTDTIDPTGTAAKLHAVKGSALSVFDGCNASTARQKNFNDALDKLNADLAAANGDLQASKDAQEKFVDAQVDFDTKNLISDYWTVGVDFQAFNVNNIDGGDIKFDVENPDPEATKFGGVSVCRVNDFPVKNKDDDGFATVKTSQDCYAARKGTVTVGSYDANKTLQITADVKVSRIKDTGIDVTDDSGSITVNITAGWCEDLENAVSDLEAIQKAAGG